MVEFTDGQRTQHTIDSSPVPRSLDESSEARPVTLVMATWLSLFSVWMSPSVNERETREGEELTPSLTTALREVEQDDN